MSTTLSTPYYSSHRPKTPADAARSPFLRVGILLGALALSISGCAPSCESKHSSTRSAQSTQTANSTAASGMVRTGNPALQFDYLASTEFLISKNDTASGDRWTARFVRDTSNPDLWRIAMGPDGMKLKDHLANGGFILHLLDTVRTLKTTEVKVSGSAESFGLDLPRFQIRWKSGGTERELSLGAPAKTPEGRFDGLYAKIQGQDSVYVAQGALLKMLEMADQFQTLRLQTLATFPADDIDEIEIHSGAGKPFYAQREGDRWTDAKHRPYRSDVDGFLQQISHARIQKFMDGDQDSNPSTFGSPSYRFVFKDRKGNPTEIRVFARSGRILSTISTRDSAVFELYPEILSSVPVLLRSRGA